MSRINEALARAARAADDTAAAPAAGTVAEDIPREPGSLDVGVAADFFPTENPALVVPAVPGSDRERGGRPTAVLPVAAENAPAGSYAQEAQGVARLLDQVDPNVVERLVIGSMPATSLEQYRRLGASLHQAQLTAGVRVVMVASAVAAEGKSLTAANLALTLSESYRRRVLLIDADLRRPSLHRLFGLPNGDGLTDALRINRDGAVSARTLSPTLSVLTAGRDDTDQMAHLTSARMRRLIQEASQVHDWVIIDTPPMALLTDAKLLGSMVDCALLVVRAGATPYPVIQRAIQAIGPERILGTVLNGAAETDVEERAYYHGYYQNWTPRRRWWWPRSWGARRPVSEAADATGSTEAE